MRLRPTSLTDDTEDEMYISATGHGHGHGHGHTTDAPRADPLDDVFGAADDDPGSEIQAAASHLSPTSQTAAAAAVLAVSPGEAENHPSDMHRLRTEHVTAGYRDGVTAAKAGSVQAGFDEGFSLGAALGVRAGELLGVLEGLVIAAAAAAAAAAAPAPAPAASSSRQPDPATSTRSTGGDGDGNGSRDQGVSGGPQSTGTSTSTSTSDNDNARISALLSKARQELSTRSVFGREFWAPDGTWTYPVPGDSDGSGGSAVIFKDVVEAHPIIDKWRAVVEAEMEVWGVGRDVFASPVGKEEVAMATDTTTTTTTTTVKATTQPAATVSPRSKAREALQW